HCVPQLSGDAAAHITLQKPLSERTLRLQVVCGVRSGSQARHMANPPPRPVGVDRAEAKRRADHELYDAWDTGYHALLLCVDGWEREKTEAGRLRALLEQLQREATESPYPPGTTPAQAVQVVVGTTERKRDSEAPKSNRQRAGEALQTPAGKKSVV